MSGLHSKPLSFLLFLSLYLQLLHSALGVDPISLDPRHSFCSGKALTNGSAFQTNLNTLFSSLNSESPTSNFYNDTAGTGSDRVYGLYLCQGDLSHPDCQKCINAATTDILKACSKRQAIIYYDYCQLRYSDNDFFGIMDAYNDFWRTNNNNNVSVPQRPLDFVSNLIKEAPHNKPMFAANASVEHSLFAMAECTMDITSADCAKCLNTIFGYIKSCCGGYQGWRLLSPSCSIRYEALSFLQNPKFASTEIVENKCSDDEFPSGDGNPQQLVDTLLAQLQNRARATGFSTSIVGIDSGSLYGLALCRGDLDPESETCLNCLKLAAEDAVYDCPNRTQAIVWKEKCLLRYSNRKFFGEVSNEIKILCGLAQLKNDAAMIQMMTSLVDEAPESPKMVAAGEVGNGTGYGLVQCTRDLSSESCKDCLTEAMGKATETCNHANDDGWRFLSGSCMARYESTAFFDTSILSPDAPNADSPSPVKSWGGACGPNLMAVVLLCLLVIKIL